MAAFKLSTPSPVSALMRYTFGSMGLGANSLPPAAAMESALTLDRQTLATPLRYRATSILFATTMRGRAASSSA